MSVRDGAGDSDLRAKADDSSLGNAAGRGGRRATRLAEVARQPDHIAFLPRAAERVSARRRPGCLFLRSVRACGVRLARGKRAHCRRRPLEAAWAWTSHEMYVLTCPL